MTFKSQYSDFIKNLRSDRLLIDIQMSQFTSFRLGGPVDLFFRASTSADLINAVTQAVRFHIPFFIIGGGTNLLVTDGGFRGLVIKNETNQIRPIAFKGGKSRSNKNLAKVSQVLYEAEGGVLVNRLVRFALDQGLQGLEYFLGQPGTVGGAVWINAHNMYENKFIGDSIIAGKIFSVKKGIRTVDRNYFKFGYDSSILQTSKDVVLSITFEFTVGDKYHLWQIGNEVLRYRRETQPGGVYSAGCTFRNISKSDAIRLATPQFTCSAGYIIESLGLKGKREGKVQFSPHHANFIIHQGEGKANDVLKLITLAKTKAKQKYALDLKPEIVILGE